MHLLAARNGAPCTFPQVASRAPLSSRAPIATLAQVSASKHMMKPVWIATAAAISAGVFACGGASERDDDAWTPPPSTLVERSFLDDGRYEEQLDVDLNGVVYMVVRYRLFGDDGRPVE